MAYATGTGANVVDFMDALRAFAVGQGWTVDKWDSANRLLFLTKGRCCVTMWGGDIGPNNATIWTGGNGTGTSSTFNDTRIWFSLNTSNNPALNTHHSHPGSVTTSNFDSDAVACNGFTGPFVAWHFFADATVGDHIHVVLQINAECYSHFSFGHVDKKGLTHNGVAYVTAHMSTWWRNVNTYINASYNTGAMNRPDRQPWPFMRNTNQDRPEILLRNSNAWPAAWNAAGVEVVGRSNASPHNGTIINLVNGLNSPADFPAGGNNGPGRLLDVVTIAEATPYSNVVPLFPIPVFRDYWNSNDGTLARICYLGDFPNVRACNMSNLTPGQEITLGGDTWKVFPAVRQDAWAQNFLTDRPTTGQFAVAYKKVP